MTGAGQATGQGHRQREKKKSSPLKTTDEALPTIFSRSSTRQRKAEILSFPTRVRPSLNYYPITFILSLGAKKKNRVLPRYCGTAYAVPCQGNHLYYSYYANKFTIIQYVKREAKTPKKTSSLLVAYHHWIYLQIANLRRYAHAHRSSFLHANEDCKRNH